jgi:hypothetical protein
MNGKRIHSHCLALLLCAGVAQAHDNSYFDSNPTPHGGQVRMAGAYHVEAVVEDGKLVLYVTDHGDQPQATAGWQGRATVLSGAEVARLPLSAAGDNRLTSAGGANFGADTRMVVVLRTADDEALELSYTPGTAAGGAANPAGDPPHH